ncbi:calcium-binding protein [Streptomyces iconiensis]|uniref:Calcium-binding protein n=1 Tax=Streptomyces iconiensis TaxID=1384038 RepID=A0ABT6ZYL2_9ACTN|nr:calcium-binding protein [Streptomyces iconiensis]MDJ1134153.1 calcium-binding protein [Streptomyces iconiensis]
MRFPLPRRQAFRSASALTLALGTGLAAPFLLAGTAGAAPSSATAAFSPSDHGILYTAGSGQTNKVTVTASMPKGPDEVTYVIDDAVPIRTGEGCSYPDSADRTKVSCTVATLESQDPYATLKLALGDGDDDVAYDNSTDQAYYFASIDLGDGQDTHRGTGRVDGNSVNGGAGDDDLMVGPVGVVRGGDGEDTLRAAEGSIAQGGDDNDTIHSDGHDSAVDGGAGDDVINGGADRQHLSGGDGNDTVNGGAGNDFMYGDKGNDILRGNAGDDTIYGNSGDDALYGGPGKDTLSGGPGKNVVHQD